LSENTYLRKHRDTGRGKAATFSYLPPEKRSSYSAFLQPFGGNYLVEIDALTNPVRKILL
jgi:hypothetical protein